MSQPLLAAVCTYLREQLNGNSLHINPAVFVIKARLLDNNNNAANIVVYVQQFILMRDGEPTTIPQHKWGLYFAALDNWTKREEGASMRLLLSGLVNDIETEIRKTKPVDLN